MVTIQVGEHRVENAPVQIYLCSELSRTDKRLDLSRELRRDTRTIILLTFFPLPFILHFISPSREKMIAQTRLLPLFLSHPLRVFLLLLRSRVSRGEVLAFGGVKNDAATLRTRWKNRRRGGVSGELTFDL